MTTYLRGKIVQLNGSAWIAMADTSGVPGQDPAWELLARGVPDPGAPGQVLTVGGNGLWGPATPAAPPTPFSLSSHVRGDWADATPRVVYAKDDVLRHNGALFVALHDNVTSEPHTTHATDWVALLVPVNEPAAITPPPPPPPPPEDEVPKQLNRPTPYALSVAGPTANADGQQRMQVTFTVNVPSTYTDGTAATFDHIDVWRTSFKPGFVTDKYERIASITPQSGTFVLDQPNDGKTYDYTVRGVDQYGIEGIASFPVEVNMINGSASNDTPQPQ